MNQDKQFKLYDQQQQDYENGLVECDQLCKAKEEPETLEEYQQTLEHYKNHGLIGGCSHGQ